MRLTRIFIIIVTLAVPTFAICQIVKPTYRPKIGFVPDERTAKAIAEAVWIPIYGASDVERSKPLTAVLHNGIWRVEGKLPKGVVGGVPIAEISKTDGRIIGVIHTK